MRDCLANCVKDRQIYFSIFGFDFSLVFEVFGPLLVHPVSEVDHDVVEDCRLDVLSHLKFKQIVKVN